ncbi:MAG TPA: pitrilysin family protein [Longimicrobiales bacterium]
MARRVMETVDDVVYAELSNGAHVVIKRRTHIPLVSIAIAARGGSLLEKRERAGYTALMGRTSIKGTAQRTAAQIAETAEGMGGSISPSGGVDLIDWEFSVPSRHFSGALSLLADVAYNAAFPEPELEVERKLTLADLQQTRDDMYRYPLRLCLQSAFANHPYGHSLEDIEQGITSASSEQLRAWRDERLYPEPWLFIVGDVDPDLVMHELERELPQPNASSVWVAPLAKWPTERRQSIEQRDKAQTALALAFPGPDRADDDVYPLHVLANAVGGLGGRFFEELRSKRSLAYTIQLLPLLRSAGGAFIAYIATSPEREAEARSALLDEFDRLRQQPLPADDIERSKRYTIGTWQIRKQTNSAQLSELLQAHVVGKGIEEINEFEDRIRAVDGARIQEVAQKYFRPEVIVEGIVRGNGKSR